jgi:DNA repair protein RecO (recombination protein O)
MIETATGVVLRTRPLTETSLIVHWLSPTVGRLATVAKGARRPNSPFRGKLDLFFECRLSFVRSRRSDLHTLREAVLADPRASLRRELGRVQQASYCAQLVEQTTETETPLPEIFQLVSEVLNEIASRDSRAETILAFELKLLHTLGLGPDPGTQRLTAGTKEIARRLAEDDWPVIQRLRASRAQAEELGSFLQGYILHHLARVPQGRQAALETGG